jgi:hypothetical protein
VSAVRFRPWPPIKVRSIAATAPLPVARHGNLRPSTGYGAAKADLARAYCDPGVAVAGTRCRWRSDFPLLMDDYEKAFGLAGEEVAAGLKEA